MISYFYKLALPIITLLVTSASIAWSASYAEEISERRDLSRERYMLDSSYLRVTKSLLDNISHKNFLDIVIISKDKLRKDHKNVKEIIIEEKRKGKQNDESKAEISLNEQVIDAFPELNFVYFDLSTDDEKKNGKKFIFDTFNMLEYMVAQNNQKNFIIYMDFNVKYEKDLYIYIKDKFDKFKDNSIIITNTELGDHLYDYSDLTFMIPAFNKGGHVLMVGPENLEIDPEKLQIVEKGLSVDKIKSEKSSIVGRLKNRFINNTDITFKQFQSHYNEQQRDVKKIPIEATKEYFITNGINSHYAALQCCILTALAWLIDIGFDNTKLIKKIKLKYTTGKVFDFAKFITYKEKKNFKEKISFNFPETSERKIIYFELNDYIPKELLGIGKLKIVLNNLYNIKITRDGVSLRNKKTAKETLVWNGVEENKGEICNDDVEHNNKGNKGTFSCLMTLEKDKIILKINGSDLEFKSSDYGYDKINKISVKQKYLARNFKNFFSIAPKDKDKVLKKIKTSGNSNINADDIKYENSVAVLFIVNKFQNIGFSEYHDNIQKLIEKLSAQGFDVKILTGEQATLVNLLELFEEIKPVSKDKLTRLFFYYFGHMKQTINEDFSEDICLTCFTGEGEENDNLLATTQLKNILNNLNFRHNTVLIDSCLSSKLIPSKSDSLDSENPTDPSYYMITGSEEEIYAWALLAKGFVEALNGTEFPYSINDIYRVIKENADKVICDIKNDVNTENRLRAKLHIDPSIYKAVNQKGNFFFNKCNDVNKNININGKNVPIDELR